MSANQWRLAVSAVRSRWLGGRLDLATFLPSLQVPLDLGQDVLELAAVAPALRADASQQSLQQRDRRGEFGVPRETRVPLRVGSKVIVSTSLVAVSCVLTIRSLTRCSARAALAVTGRAHLVLHVQPVTTPSGEVSTSVTVMRRPSALGHGLRLSVRVGHIGEHLRDRGADLDASRCRGGHGSPLLLPLKAVGQPGAATNAACGAASRPIGPPLPPNRAQGPTRCQGRTSWEQRNSALMLSRAPTRRRGAVCGQGPQPSQWSERFALVLS